MRAGTVAGARFFGRSAQEVAADLLGMELAVDDQTSGRIVEVEWYDQTDPASHSFRGPTARCQSMFGPPGHLYVYRSYGVHWCLNVVCEPVGQGAAVLIRALEPVRGLALMRRRRGVEDVRRLCSGPGRLTQALGVDGGDDGVAIGDGRVTLRRGDPIADVLVGPRIGLSVATERQWRRGVAGSRYLSRPFPKEVAV